MKACDFSVFCHLFSELHHKAFNEPLSHLAHGKAQALSWIIYESTGENISYKTLSNFATAVLTNDPKKINPNDFTLSIFVKFIHSPMGTQGKGSVAWFLYRSRFLENTAKVPNGPMTVLETFTI